MQRELSGEQAQIDLLHMNCEGCEIEVLERLLDGGVMDKVLDHPSPNTRTSCVTSLGLTSHWPV